MTSVLKFQIYYVERKKCAAAIKHKIYGERRVKKKKHLLRQRSKCTEKKNLNSFLAFKNQTGENLHVRVCAFCESVCTCVMQNMKPCHPQYVFCIFIYFCCLGVNVPSG